MQVDTSNILFICGGAFVGLDKQVSDRTMEASMGFGNPVRSDLASPCICWAVCPVDSVRPCSHDSVRQLDLVSHPFTQCYRT